MIDESSSAHEFVSLTRVAFVSALAFLFAFLLLRPSGRIYNKTIGRKQMNIMTITLMDFD